MPGSVLANGDVVDQTHTHGKTQILVGEAEKRSKEMYNVMSLLVPWTV